MQTPEGLWKLSPSSLYGFTECQACYWLENHVGRVPSFPMPLNTAMDTILKHRYDWYRSQETFPPEVLALEQQGIKPFRDMTLLSKWRNDYMALSVCDEAIGYILRGKIDDVSLEHDGRLIPNDYKATGSRPDEDKQKYYVDQLASYGFMFRKHGHAVSDRAFLFHYYPADRTDPGIAVSFTGFADEVDIVSVDIESKFAAIVELLNGPYPGDNSECDLCSAIDSRSKGKLS